MKKSSAYIQTHAVYFVRYAQTHTHTHTLRIALCSKENKNDEWKIASVR